jgi:hypothetical protein
MLTLEGKRWTERADDDKRNPKLNTSDGRYLTYDELVRERGEPYADVATEPRFLEVEAASQRALDRIADELSAAAPDAVVIIGDDQQELFDDSNMPAISAYYGERIVMHPFEVTENSPSWIGPVAKGYAMDDTHEFAACPELALEIIRGLIERDVDIGASARVKNPREAGFGHAYGFLIERLFGGRNIPVVPILLNTYYPPNQITARRSYDIGLAMRAAIEASRLPMKVAVAASGGLSHFIVDDALDNKILKALKANDAQTLRSLPQDAMNSGSSEIRNWIVAAAMLSSLKFNWSEYYPARRTPAGTGTGIGFATWG